MRAIVKRAPVAGFDFAQDVADLALGPGDVRVEIASASLCGTDRGLVDFTPAAEAFGLAFPVVLGHECAGTVIEVGSAVSGFSVGDRVAFESHIACLSCAACRRGDPHLCDRLILLGLHINGGFAERAVVPAHSVIRLPDAVALEHGAILEPAGVAIHALQRSTTPVAGSRVLIAGGGPIGIVLVQAALALGAVEVTVIEPNPFRAAMAEREGARVVAPGPAIAEIRDIDIAIEVSGVSSSLPALLGTMRSGGCVVVVGIASEPIPIDTASVLIKRAITLRGSYGRMLWSTWDLLLGLVGSGRIDLNRVVTHRLPLEEFGTALGLLSGDAGKILLLPGMRPTPDTTV